jgi:cytochrome c oxidase subunit 1
MAITDTRPAPDASAAPSEDERFVGLRDHDPGGLAGFIGTGDHKALGRAYLAVATVFGVAAFSINAAFHAQLAHDYLPKDTIDQVFSLGRVGAVFLFAIPLFLGLATYVVPLQVGANTVAFPRAASAAFWGWLIGSSMVIGAYLVNGGPDGGASKGIDLFYVAMALVVVSLLLASVCVVTTALALRTPGLGLVRIPLFAWSMLVATSLWLFSLPVALGNLVLIYLDHHYGSGSAFAVDQFSSLSWLFGPPQIYAVVIPVLGVVSDVVATMSGARQTQRGVMMTAIGGFGVLTFGAYVQPVFNPEVWNQALFVGMSVLIVLPMLALLAGWLFTLKSGKPLLRSPLLFALGSGVVLLVATLAGALYAIKPLQLHDAAWVDKGYPVPPFSTGLFLLVIAAAALGGMAGVTFWAPKLFGRFANDSLAKLAALVGVVGGLVAGLPLLVFGFAVKASGLADSAKFLNGTAAVGIAMVLVAVVLVVIALVGGRGEADDDAWGRGQSLEWAIGSPPPAGNFGLLAPVESAEPVLDLAESEDAS